MHLAQDSTLITTASGKKHGDDDVEEGEDVDTEDEKVRDSSHHPDRSISDQ